MNLAQRRDKEVRDKVKQHFRLWSKQVPGVKEYVTNRTIKSHLVEQSPSVESCAYRETPGWKGPPTPPIIHLYVHRDWVQEVLNRGISTVANGFILRATRIEDMPVWQVCVLRPWSTQLIMTEEYLAKTRTGLVTHHNLLALLAKYSASLSSNSVLPSVSQAHA
jgi:hypothetical protein